MPFPRFIVSPPTREKLFTETTKCYFGVEDVLFLRYVISCQGLEVDKSKIDTIWN